jgi:UDP-glucose:(heptosyl)LPS alpha-1,3-glucosyltransferase
MKIALAIDVIKRLGGKQRDCLAVGQYLLARGHDVTLLTTSVPRGAAKALPYERIRVTALSNHGRVRAFAEALKRIKAERAFDVMIAFDPVPDCDFLYAAEQCLAANPPKLKRWLPRYRTRLEFERAVFSSASKVTVLYLNRRQRDGYWQFYGPAPERSAILPVHTDRFTSEYYAERGRVRRELSIPETVRLAISIAQNPAARRKGLDRVLSAMRQIPDLHLLVVGTLDWKIRLQAYIYGVSHRLRMLPYQDHVMDVMGAADVLLHPARDEAGGLVIVEALLAGIPVVCTEICGYASEIEQSKAGFVLREPFQPDEFTAAIQSAIAERDNLQMHARAYADFLAGQESWLAQLARYVEQFPLTRNQHAG